MYCWLLELISRLERMIRPFPLKLNELPCMTAPDMTELICVSVTVGVTAVLSVWPRREALSATDVAIWETSIFTIAM